MLDVDPFGRSDPFSGLAKLPGFDDGRRARHPRAEFRRPLSPEHSTNFGQQVLNSGASGLQHVLGTPDKPGQAVRGMLAGHGLSALKHLVPFSELDLPYGSLLTISRPISYRKVVAPNTFWR